MPVTIKFPKELSYEHHRYNFMYSNNYYSFGLKINKDNLKHTERFNKIKKNSGNGFIDAVRNAFNEGKNLIISPDDLYITILTSLMTYVNYKPEKLRPCFGIDINNKITLKLNEEYDNTDNADILYGLNQLSSWLQCDFTTTTKKEKFVSLLLTKATSQKYFRSYMYFRHRKIPEVQFLGEKSDYENIRKKVEKFGLIDDDILRDWSMRLIKIIDQFILAFDNNNSTLHEEFWNNISTNKYDEPSRFLTGWLANLCPFTLNKTGFNYSPEKINMNIIPTGFMEVHMHIIDPKVEFDVTAYVGQFGYEYRHNTFSSRIDYIITKDENSTFSVTPIKMNTLVCNIQ